MTKPRKRPKIATNAGAMKPHDPAPDRPVAAHPAPATLALTPDPANPNRLDADTKAALARALAEFGDLSGLVLNRRTGLLIGGHQRADLLRDGRLDVADLPKPEPDGTVARGHLVCNGRRYAVRVVDWPEDRAHAALLAANRFGRLGQDDAALLKDLLEQADAGQTTDTGQLLADLTGYDAEERERLALQVHQDLAERIAGEEVYTVTDSKADTRAAKIADRLQKLAKNHRDKLEKAEAIVLSADCPDFLCLDDPALTDFLAELRRYADQGDPSPLASILGKVHRL